MSAPVVIPRMQVTGPPPPVRHKFGLFAAATVLENVSPHELTGVEYETVCSTRVDAYPAPCEPTVPPGTDLTKVPQQTASRTEGSPFALYAADECILGRDQATARAQLRQRFTGGEQRAVEQIVFTGAMGNTPNLAQEAVHIHPTAVNDLVDAIGLLEQWLASNYGGLGIIHAPMSLGPRLHSQMQMIVSGPRAATPLGSNWVLGAGYPGTPPEGVTDDGTVWLYATPPITVRRSALLEPADWSSGAFSREENLGFLLSERLYVVDWPCDAAAIEITDLPRPGYTAAP